MATGRCSWEGDEAMSYAQRMENAQRYGRRSDNLFDTSTSGRLKVWNEAHCRMCRRHRLVRPLTRHHLIPLSWWAQQDARIRRYRNANANLVPLCREDHDLVDHKDQDVREMARRELRRSLWQPEIAFIIRVIGEDWLRETYPLVTDLSRVESRLSA